MLICRAQCGGRDWGPGHVGLCVVTQPIDTANFRDKALAELMINDYVWLSVYITGFFLSLSIILTLHFPNFTDFRER